MYVAPVELLRCRSFRTRAVEPLLSNKTGTTAKEPNVKESWAATIFAVAAVGLIVAAVEDLYHAKRQEVPRENLSWNP